MDALELRADRLDEQRRDDRAVHAAGERQQHLAAANLLADELDLVGHEVLHVPVLRGLAGLEEERLEDLVRARLRLRPGVHAQFALRARMRDGHHGNPGLVDLGLDVDALAVDDVVRTTGKNHALDVGERLELARRDVVRIDLAVDAEGADLARQHRVLRAAEVENDDHVLFHACSWM